MTMTQDEIRQVVLETAVEQCIARPSPGNWDSAMAAIMLLRGLTYREARELVGADSGVEGLRAAFPELVPEQTTSELAWAELTAGKSPPVAIYHEGDARAYYSATEEERSAWNSYAQRAADAFNASPRLDSYDSTSTHTGRNRDGRITGWCPPKFFPEWLAERRGVLR